MRLQHHTTPEETESHLHLKIDMSICIYPRHAVSADVTASDASMCVHLQRHRPAAGLEWVLIRSGDAASLVLDMEPCHVGGVPRQLLIIGAHDGRNVGLVCAALRPELVLLSHLIVDVDD